jgi:hypothetical protein
MRLVRRCVAVTLAAVIGSGSTSAEPLLAINNGLLYNFDSATPAVAGLVAVTGLTVGDVIVGMDRRPATKQVFLLARTVSGGGRLYLLDTISGAAAFHANLSADPTDVTAPFALLTGVRFAMDFNPVPDRIRVVSNDNTNLRVNPNTGLVITDDAVNPGDPNVVAAAYINNRPGQPTTALFVIDSATDSLYMQNPPNNGVLVLVGALGVDAADNAAFDVSGDTAAAYAALRVGGVTGLYNINLATGAAAPVGSIVGNPDLAGFTAGAVGVLFGSGFE